MITRSQADAMDMTAMALRQSFLFPALSRLPRRRYSLPLSRTYRSPAVPSPPMSTMRLSCSLSPLRSTFPGRPYTSVMIVPTGVGAAIGGYAGDALPVAWALASAVDCLVSHPNVMNAAMLYWPMPNALYVEGYALDKFADGSWALQPVHQNKVVAAGDMCAICQEKMHAPILLRCKHIFCEDCVLEWFERERTCLLCRALVKLADLRSFGDGSTSLFFQLF